MLISFVLFLTIIAAIGVSSARLSRGTKQDYYLASSSVPPSLVGLSAVATNNSGYMFIGVIGYTYTTGLAAIWMMIGWILGDFLASLFVHSRLRTKTAERQEVSFAGVISHWHLPGSIGVQRCIGVISLLFLLAYSSAQLVAGSKALHVIFDWPLWTGAVLGATLVLAYCLAGGIRASIWTDAIQSTVMISAMALLLVTAVSGLGGIQETRQQMAEIDGFLNWLPDTLPLPGLAGAGLFFFGWLCAGFSVIGQPHIMVRFMTLDHGRNMTRAKLWYYLWFTGFWSLATGVGMLSRLYLDGGNEFDPELALPTMAMELLHPFLVGLILAGIFAATLSTADSLVINCSSAVSHDLLPNRINSTAGIKLVTAGVTLLALGGALINSQSVFALVLMSWSGLASAFAPLLLYLSLGGRCTSQRAIIAMVAGLLVALGWRYLGFHSVLYEGLPGMVTGLSVLLWPNSPLPSTQAATPQQAGNP